MTLKTGTVLNDIYRVVNLLGKGSMGNVYLVERIEDDKKFVIKELNFSQEAGLDYSSAKEIFRREAEFMEKFAHPGLPAMYGVFSQNEKEYLIMDYIEGKTLEEIISSSPGPLNEKKAVTWTIEIAIILDYLHNSFHQPVVYRDLKPSNIIIKPDGKPVLVDFGIARYYNPDKNSDTFNYGSPGYAAPEQYKGRGRSTPQSDVFGLGVILFQMLTKYDPSEKPLQFPSMKSLNPVINEELEGIVLRAVQLDPLKRYTGVKDFKEILEKYKGISPGRKREKTPVPEWYGKARWRAVSAAVLCFIFIFLTIELETNHIISVEYTCIPGLILLIACPVSGLIISISGSRKSSATKEYSSKCLIKSIIYNSISLIISIFFYSFLCDNIYFAGADGKLACCENNLKNLATEMEIYYTDNNSVYPSTLYSVLQNKTMKNIPDCPGYNKYYYIHFNQKKNSYSYIYKVSDDFQNYTLWCTYKHIGQSRGYPMYTPYKGLILSKWEVPVPIIPNPFYHR